MGSSLIKETKQLLGSHQYKWLVRSTGPSSTLLLDQHSHVQGEKYSIDYSLIHQEWPLYVLRRNHPKHLVTVYDILQEGESSLCASSREVAVVIQPIPYRLSDLGTLTFQQGLYILKCVGEGYRVLAANRVGFYLLDETAICFTRAGLCKFWINENLHFSRPQANRIITELQFITSLLEMIELRVTHMPNEYITERENSAQTLKGMLAVVDRFRDPQVRCMASLCSLTHLGSPHSTKHPSSGKSAQERTEHKLSIAKSRRLNRKKREESRPREALRVDGSEPKKLSLSFSKRQRKQVELKLGQMNSNQHLFISPHREVTPSLLLSQYSSRDSRQSRLQNNCLVFTRSISRI